MRKLLGILLAGCLILSSVMPVSAAALEGSSMQNDVGEENQVGSNEDPSIGDNDIEDDIEDNDAEDKDTEDEKADGMADVNDDSGEESSDIEDESKDEEPELTALDENEVKAKSSVPTVKYRTHMSKLGWQPYVSDGATSGVTGRKLNVEALSVSTDATDLGIEYSAHVSKTGWQSYVSGGKTAGTTGKALSVEALKIRLTGNEAEKYNIYYRAYVSNVGWLDWASNNMIAGSTGWGYGLEAIQVVIRAKDQSAPGATGIPYISGANVKYRAHVSNVGWQSYVSNGATAGTSGRGLPMEAVQIYTDKAGLKLQYSAHVSNIGWRSYVSDKAVGGTTGRALKLEAIRIRLAGEEAKNYDIYYRTHVANIGWLDWAKNGADSGSVGLGYGIEAIQIKILPKKLTFSGSTKLACCYKAGVSYKAHVASIGWQSAKSNGSLAGTVGKNRAIEAMRINVSGMGSNLGIKYAAHVSGIGWQSYVSNGALTGTTGQARKVEAIKIALTGNASKYYDVWYRTHVSNMGWMGWTKNGSSAGTKGFAQGMEGIQIKVLPKGSKAPGSTNSAFLDASSVRLIARFSTQCTNTYEGYFNMSRALSAFNGLTVKPGQTVSFFGVAGPCGRAQGYLPGGVVGGIGYGGGICQASTTLYGAVIRAGLTIVERRPHTVPSTYVPIGQDAMVSYGTSDFKFKNNLGVPITIKTYTDSQRRLYVEIYGVQPYWFDRVEVNSWSTGSRSAAAERVYYKNNKVVKRENLPSSYYYY